jgi:tripartite motif-containing protein 71
VTSDSAGNIYVVDGGGNRVEKFDARGNYLLQFGTVGSGNGQLNAPFAINVDARDNVYVVDVSNNRIERFSSSGVFF